VVYCGIIGDYNVLRGTRHAAPHRNATRRIRCERTNLEYQVYMHMRLSFCNGIDLITPTCLTVSRRVTLLMRYRYAKPRLIIIVAQNTGK